MQKRLLPFLILALSCAALGAQESLTTTFANNNGGPAGGAVYFTLTAGTSDITVTDVDFNLNSPAGSSGSVDVYTTPGTHVGNELNMALWTNVATCPIAASNPAGTPTKGVLSVPLTILAGTSLGVAFVDGTLGTSHAYTAGTGSFPLQYTACGLTLDAGSASSAPFTGVVFSPRVVNATINYAVAGSCASIESVGEGCTNTLSSAYELTSLDVFTLNNTMAGIDFISTGGGYVITPSAGAIRPVGTLDPAAVPVASVGDDSVVAVGTLGLVFGSNGWLATGIGNTNNWVPTPGLFLDNPAAQWSCWSDLQPNAGGTITYEEAGALAQLTYTDVFAWGTTNQNTFQFTIDTALGNVSLYFGAMASTSPHPMMIGYSPAGPSRDPGSVGLEAELTANGAIVLAAADTLPLTLEGSGRPVMGAAPVAYDVTTSNIEATALFHIGALSPTEIPGGVNLPGIDPSCSLYMAGPILTPAAVVVGGPGSLTWTAFANPAIDPALNGFQLLVQSVTLGPSIISASLRLSNALRLTLGEL